MLTKIKKLWNKLRGKKEDESGILVIHPTPANTSFVQTHQSNLLTFTGANGVEIFCIDANGNAKWLVEDSYDEAAEIFLNSLGWRIEDAANIQQSRMEWEEKITEKLVEVAEEKGGSIKADELTDVVRKCIMYDKLKGKYGEN